MTTAFVTGGSGFIGGRLIQRLVADGFDVRALARSPAAQRLVAALGATPVPGDLGDVSALRAGAGDSELAFHSAALTTRGGSRSDFWRVNVDGTVHVLEALRGSSVRRLVHVGTEAALLDGRALVGVDETAPLRPDSRAPYAASKAVAEQAVLTANGGSLETLVVRPRFVWGAGDATVLPELVHAVRSRRFAWIGGGTHRTDVTHVDNAVHGLVLAAQRGRPGQAYFVTDGQPVIFRDFITELMLTQGVTPPRRSVPAGAARVLAGAGETTWRLARLPGAPPLDYMSLWLSSLECTIDISKARVGLGYAPVRSRVEGMDELRGDRAG
ncbi:MAG: NAD-dependent epimerase/dehydratase family protein [Actinomycetota bacterium]|nr:NAD-dependent epimerase/dehydratase family protein [Actinomycetota bacterium]